MLWKIKQELKQGKTILQFAFLKATGQALGMVAPLVVAKFFSPELFGSYSLAKMVIFFFTSLLIASAQTPFIVFANQERAKTGKISKSFSIQCIFLALSIIAFLLINLIFNRAIIKLAEILPLDLLFVFLAFIGIAAKTFLSNLFMALGQRIRSSFVELVFGGLTLGLVLALCLMSKINLRTAFLVYLISAITTLVMFIRTIDFKQLLPFRIDKEHFKGMFNFVKWLMFGTTAVYFINWGDLLVLRFLGVSMEKIGAYNLGYLIFKGVVMLTYIINAYFLPFITEHIEDTVKIRNYLFSKRPKIFLLGLIAIVLLFAVAPCVFRFFYGDAYPGSIAVLRILLVGSVMILYNTFYIPILNALKKYKLSQTTVVLQVLINVLLNLILIPKYGFYGAAIATVLAYSFKVIVYELYFRTKLRHLVMG